MLNLNKLFFGQPKTDNSLKVFNLLPNDLKRLLTLSEIRLVGKILKQYHVLRQKKGQNIASLISDIEYISKELLLQKKKIPNEAVQTIVNANYCCSIVGQNREIHA